MGKETVLITGASGGIGKEFALVFAKNGYDLVLVARNEKRLEFLRKKLESDYNICVTVLVQDMTEDNAALILSDKINKSGISVNILVNNAGFGDNNQFLDSNWEKQKHMVRLNILALIQMTYVFGGQMRKRGHGRILNMASAAAFTAGPGMSVYYASKAFVLSFSEAVSEELKGTGVTVTAVCPGPTSTGFEESAGMHGSRMFHAVKPQSAKHVAVDGFRACMSKRPALYHGKITKIGSVGARLLPRSLMRKIAKEINKVPGGNS